VVFDLPVSRRLAVRRTALCFLASPDHDADDCRAAKLRSHRRRCRGLPIQQPPHRPATPHV